MGASAGVRGDAPEGWELGGVLMDNLNFTNGPKRTDFSGFAAQGAAQLKVFSFSCSCLIFTAKFVPCHGW
jgi:hypothetical protein